MLECRTIFKSIWPMALNKFYLLEKIIGKSYHSLVSNEINGNKAEEENLKPHEYKELDTPIGIAFGFSLKISKGKYQHTLLSKPLSLSNHLTFHPFSSLEFSWLSFDHYHEQTAYRTNFYGFYSFIKI